MRIVSTLFIAGLFVACAAPSGDGPNPNGGYATPEDFCAARAEAECTATVVQKCGGKDESSCVTNGKTGCMAEIPQGTRYVPEKAVLCIDKTRAAYADGQLTADEVKAMKEACGEVFSGPGVARAPCTVNADCSSADGLKCLIPLGEQSGKCLAPHVIQQGAPCLGEADVCTPEFFCDPMKKQCVPKSGDGESCWLMKPCLPNLKCYGGGIATWCGELGAAGTPCVDDVSCASGLCSKAKSSAEGTCADTVVLSPLAAACAPFQ